MPRSFATYSDLISYATAVAADQGALDQKLSDTQSQFARVMADLGVASARLASVTSEHPRGGALQDIDAETISRDSRADESSLSVKAADLYRTTQQLRAAGALTAPQTASWQMPTNGVITQPFGPTSLSVEPARVYHGVSYAHFHDGVDIAGEWAADIVAPARGRVVFVGTMMDGAEVVVIAHDGGLVSMYAHLDNWVHPPTVAAGDEVAAGQKIGTVGMTGIVTGAHLHWGVWRSGELIDPLTLVAR
jgi:murein DD-endopeptidase MepM/ murein hydrolase activator NlpD